MKRIFISIFIFSFITGGFSQIPAGYYDAANGLSGENLRTALRNITQNSQVKLSYSAVWTAYGNTDVRPAPNNTLVWDMYSDIPGGSPMYTFTIFSNQCGTATAEGDCYSREHSVPNSWWGGLDDATHPQYTDLHHLFPADQYVNSYKSAHPIGQVSTPTFTSSNGCKVGPCSYPAYSGVVFEPINEYKGDMARAYFYIAMRYKDDLGSWVRNYPTTEAKYIIDTTTNNFKSWFIDMMLTWHYSDTVSTKEINRNNAIYYNTAQHNRNPFVDHPEYVNAIWGTVVHKPSAYPEQFSARNIHLQWTDNQNTTLADHFLIRMSKIGFSAIVNPQNGVYYPDNASDLNVDLGVQQAWFRNLERNTTYYFKIFPYTGSGNSSHYKTDGTVQSVSYTTN